MTLQLKLYQSLFVSRPDAYAIWRNGRPTAIYKPLNENVITDHLDGCERVGTYLILPDGRTPFLVLDLDDQDKNLVRELLGRLEHRQIPAYVELSKSKGFHIWMFFVKPIPAGVVRKFARALLGDLQRRKIEIFPKQDSVGEGGLGNCIWLPLFPPDVEEDKTCFVDEDLNAYPNQWKFLAKIERVPEDQIAKALETLGRETADRRSVTRKAEETPRVVLRFPRTKFWPRLAYDPAKLPICAHRILWEGVDEDHRNNCLFVLTKQLRNQGLRQRQVEDLVLASNAVCRPPLPEREVFTVLKSVSDKGYTSLGCDDEFIASLCSRHCPIMYPHARNLTALQLIEQANALPVIHPSQAFECGKLWYGLRLGRKQHIWVNGERQAFTVEQMHQTFTVEKMPTKLRWGQASIKSFLHGDTSVNPYDLYLQIRTLVTDQIIFRAQWQPTIIALWIMGGYVYRLFSYYAYLWATSPGRRAAKSKLLEIISALAYNATPVLTNPSEAALFRDTSVDGSTQVLDEVESLRSKDQEKQAALFSVLNCGFKNGATVPRYNLNAGAVENLDVYCPRAIAGINRIHPTLADRCIKIFLKRKSPDETAARWDERKLRAQLQQIRDHLHIFGLQFASAIAGHYANSDSVQFPRQVDDRARDILEPLFAIARVIDDANPKAMMASQLIKASESIAEDRSGDESEDEETVIALELLARNFPRGKENWVLGSTQAANIFPEDERLGWIQRPQQACTLLRRLGFKSSTHRVGPRIIRGYKIRKHVLLEMCRSYGLPASADALESSSREEGVTSATSAGKG